MKIDNKHVFEKIYEKEADSVFRFCLIRISDRQQAIDVTQEAFLRLWQAISTEKEISNYRAFLFKVTRNLIIDWYRKKKSIPFTDMENEISEENFDLSDGMTKNIIELGAEGRYLLEKINELNPAYRQVIYFRFIEDLSPSEIGQILGISANAVSVRLNRGLLDLKKKAGYNIN